MALGNERLMSKFQSDQGKFYKVRIFDSDFPSGYFNLFRLDGNGFTLTYKGEGDDRNAPIKASTCEFGMYVEGDASTPTGVFISLLKDAPQGRFKLEIRISDTDGSYQQFWRGIIISDIIELEDESFPRLVKIKAVDGLSLMKDIPFNRDVYNGVNGNVKGLYTFENIVCNFLRYYTGGVVDFFGTNETFIREQVHWYEDTMPTPISSKGPWEYSAIYPYAFMEVEYSDGVASNEKPRSAFEALEAILKCWGLRIFQQQGFWVIVHFDMYRNDESLWYYRRLSYTNTELGSGTLILEYGQQDLGNVQDSTNLTKLAGGVDEFYAPLKSVRATYGNWTNAGLYSEQLSLTEYTDNATMESNLIDLGFIDNSDNAYLSVEHTFGVVCGDATSVDYSAFYDTVDVVYMLKVGNYYWDDNNNEWTTTQTIFTYQIMFAQGLWYNNTWVDNYQFVAVSFVTTNPPVSDTVEFFVTFESSNIQTANGDSFYSGYTAILLPHSSQFTSRIQYLREGQSSIERIFIAQDDDSTSNEVLDLEQLLIGDGPTASAPSWGRIRINNGSTWLNTVEENWQAWETGNEGRITQILCEETFAGQRDFIPLRKYNFRINYISGNSQYFGPLVALRDTTNGNDIMVTNGYKFYARIDTVEGEYWKADSDFNSITNTLEEPFDWGMGEYSNSSDMFSM